MTSLIQPIPGGAIDRAAWSVDYLARTVFYNGYWREFQPEPIAKRRLKDGGAFGDREAVAAAIRAGKSPIDLALLRMAEMGMSHLTETDRTPFWEQWQVVEATLNARLRLAFALADSAALGRALERLLPAVGPLGELTLAAVNRERDKKQKYGIPDAISGGRDGSTAHRNEGPRSHERTEVRPQAAAAVHESRGGRGCLGGGGAAPRSASPAVAEARWRTVLEAACLVAVADSRGRENSRRS